MGAVIGPVDFEEPIAAQAAVGFFMSHFWDFVNHLLGTRSPRPRFWQCKRVVAYPGFRELPELGGGAGCAFGGGQEQKRASSS